MVGHVKTGRGTAAGLKIHFRESSDFLLYYYCLKQLMGKPPLDTVSRPILAIFLDVKKKIRERWE